jgi:hypothetical protein
MDVEVDVFSIGCQGCRKIVCGWVGLSTNETPKVVGGLSVGR